MKLIISLASLAIFVLGLITAVPMILSVDDLKNCYNGPQSTDSSCRPADAIVAISGGDTSARTQEAILLYKAGWAPRLIFSGAAQDRSGISNAAAMRLQAQKSGVDPANITIEEESVDTADNAKKIKNIISISGIKRLILVTSPYHQRRASIEFSRVLGPNVQIVNHPTTSDSAWPATWFLSPFSWSLVFSELTKIIFISVAGHIQ